MAEKIKILVVDDSTPNRMILADEFRGIYHVLLASNGREALEILSKNSDIAIVLLDLIMPVMDGFDVLKSMLADDTLSTIPVLAITSSDNPADFINALDLGAFDVMKKPIDLKIAGHKIRNILARTSVFREQKTNDIFRHIIENNEIDEKTGIYNKETFCRCAKELMLQHPERKYVVVHEDIDDFKVLNEVYGIAEGDRILQSFGEFLIRNAIPNMIYGHWEADHFVICMSLEDFNSHHMAELVLNPIQNRIDYNISVRMGVYIVDDITLDVSLMCDRALLALKSIKNNFTKHIAFYDDAMRLELLERQQVVSEMNTALEEGQFIVYLQPQYNYETRTLHGAEALVRWKHPERGLIPPIKFIPVFEENGFITHLDEYVWEEVCKFQRNWLDRGYNIVPISVNVSRTDICSLRLAEFFRKLVEKYDLPTSAIRIEITESAYIDTPAQLVNSVEKLRQAGFSVEMDDFGSGYSSLNTLKDVPVDMLKLDMKFIEDEGKESRGGSILSSVVRMSNWLRLPVLAEGVETKNQADYLKSIGCVYMQGYYFAKPMPVSEYEKLLSAEKFEEVKGSSYTENIDDAMEFLNASTQATLLFNSFVGGAAIIEFDGNTVEAVRINDKFFTVIDSNRDDYKRSQNDMLSLFDNENRTKFIRTLRRAIDSKQESSCEMCTTLLHPGHETWTLARVRLLATNVDKYLFYLVIENISQKMNLLTSNLRLTDQLTTIINNVPSGIIDYEINAEGHVSILYFNDRLPQMFGFTRDEYMQEFEDRPLAAVYPDDMAEVESSARELYEGTSNGVNLRYRHVCKDGSFKWIELNGGKTRRQGMVTYVTATFTDLNRQIISEQTAATKERELTRERKLMKSLYEKVPCGIMVYQHGINGNRLIECNELAWKSVGYDDEQQFRSALMASGGFIRSHEEDLETVRTAEFEVLSGGEEDSRVIEHRIECRDGSFIKVRNMIQKVCLENGVEYLQYVFYGI